MSVFIRVHAFLPPPHHLEQKHTHLHIDFVNALFIYFLWWCWCWRWLSLSFIQAHITRILNRFFSVHSFILFHSSDPIADKTLVLFSLYLWRKEIVSRSRWLPIIYFGWSVLVCFCFPIRIIYNSIVDTSNQINKMPTVSLSLARDMTNKQNRIEQNKTFL